MIQIFKRIWRAAAPEPDSYFDCRYREFQREWNLPAHAGIDRMNRNSRCIAFVQELANRVSRARGWKRNEESDDRRLAVCCLILIATDHLTRLADADFELSGFIAASVFAMPSISNGASETEAGRKAAPAKWIAERAAVAISDPGFEKLRNELGQLVAQFFNDPRDAYIGQMAELLDRARDAAAGQAMRVRLFHRLMSRGVTGVSSECLQEPGKLGVSILLEILARVPRPMPDGPFLPEIEVRARCLWMLLIAGGVSRWIDIAPEAIAIVALIKSGLVSDSERVASSLSAVVEFRERQMGEMGSPGAQIVSSIWTGVDGFLSSLEVSELDRVSRAFVQCRDMIRSGGNGRESSLP